MTHAAGYQAVASFPELAPHFALGISCDEDHILGIDFLAQRPSQPPVGRLAAEAVRQIRAYLEAPGFSFDLPRADAGTAFQRRVWHLIARIPMGHTRSYGELAGELNSAPRAVGGACGANPYPLVVPCHRVIGAGGSLGGFARERGGLLLEIKRWLLRHEGH